MTFKMQSIEVEAEFGPPYKATWCNKIGQNLCDHYLLDISISPRNNQDQVINDRCLFLIDMCISAQLRILNGKKLGDLTGDLTCHKHNGNSSIEYCIVSQNLFNEINLFEVGNHLSDLSDHSKIYCIVIILHWNPFF